MNFSFLIFPPDFFFSFLFRFSNFERIAVSFKIFQQVGFFPLFSRDNNKREQRVEQRRIELFISLIMIFHDKNWKIRLILLFNCGILFLNLRLNSSWSCSLNKVKLLQNLIVLIKNWPKYPLNTSNLSHNLFETRLNSIKIKNISSRCNSENTDFRWTNKRSLEARKLTL